MSKVVVTDQLSIYGDVDIPYSPDNAMALLSALGEFGFSPTTFSELDSKTEQVTNRLSFIKDQIKIKFHADKILIGNAPDPSKDLDFDFNETVPAILKIIFTAYPHLKSSHCVRSGDYFAPEVAPQQMIDFRKAHLKDSEIEPIEWRTRQTFESKEHKETIFYTMEVGRSQGLLNIKGNKTPFDRIRYKIITQTDVINKTTRYDYEATLQCVSMLISEHGARLSQVESSIYE